MQHISHTLSSLAFGAAFLLGGAGAAMSQGLPGGASSLNETHGDWTVACAAPDETVRCAISQTQVEGESGQRILAIELMADTGAGSAQGTLVMPFGLDLDAGIRLGVDEADPFASLRFSTCLPAGCLVPLAFDGETISALRNGTALTIGAVASGSAQEIALSVSLGGFGSALARVADLGGL